jgi:PKD repeat protein
VSDEKAKPGNWLKAVLGTVAGLFSGGVMMYLSPLVDRVVKPQKPMANFAVEANGLQVTLHNRSTGGDGWWDFGDGSALEPAPASADGVTHAYAKPGTYSVKLSLRSFFGDEAERSVQVDVSAANTAPPSIVDFQAIPVGAQAIAPATFRLVSRAKNADVAVWDVEEQMEIVKDSPNQQERLVTFATPGRHVVQFAVLNGSASEKRALPIDVKPPPTGAIMAVLHVADQGTKLEHQAIPQTIVLTPEGQTKPFERTIAAQHGHRYAAAELAGPPPAGVRNVAVQISPDRTQVKVTGELLPATAKPGQSKPAMVALPLSLKTEKQSADGRKPVDSSAPLAVPGTTVLPLAALPANWVNPKRQVTLDLRYGAQSLMKSAAFPYTNALMMGNRTYTLTATLAGDQVRIDVQ